MSTTAPLSTGGGLLQEIQEVITSMELLRVPELKAICRAVELPINGRKAILQDRIRAYLKNSCAIGHIDPWRPKTVRILIEKVRSGDSLPRYLDLWQTLRSGAFNHPVATGHLPVSALQETATSTTQPSHVEHGDTAWPSGITNSQSGRSSGTNGGRGSYLHFKVSPFYKMKKLIPETAQKINITTVRGACTAKFKLTKNDWNLLQSHKKYRLYLLCGARSTTQATSGEPIQFPHPNEIRFNSNQIKDNVRGLKNKVGTAKPADLTQYVKPSPQLNVLEIVYAFTKIEYSIYCYIVEQVTPEELLKEVLAKPKIIKAATLNYIKRTLSEEEDDLITTSTVMSLQCPVSYTRMKYPVKSIMCNHLQCYDALWYIYSQMQIPTWQCPVCQIGINLKDLAISEYVDDILKNSSDDVEQVELSSDGSWIPVVEETSKSSEQPKAKETVVKKEHDEDEDENDLPLSKLVRGFSKSASPTNEPVVISLDSDTEDAAPTSTEPVANKLDKTRDPETSNTGTGSSNGSYMDHSANDSRQTLDPRALEANTPTVARPGSEGNESSVDYVNRHAEVPNILGKTPLNHRHSDQDTSLHDEDPSSPTPISNTRGLYTPAASMSESPRGFLPNEQVATTSMVPGPNTTSTTPVIQAGGTHILPRRPSNVLSNSILGLTGQTVAPPTNPPTLPPLIGSAAPLNPSMGNPNREHSSALASPVGDGVPTLPPLPYPTGQQTSDSRISNGLPRGDTATTNIIGSGLADTSVHQLRNTAVPSRNRRPIVSPFIPKRPYMNALPQKRHLTNNSTPHSSPNMNEGNPLYAQSLGVSVGDAPTARLNNAATISRRSDDVIDLTSD